MSFAKGPIIFTANEQTASGTFQTGGGECFIGTDRKSAFRVGCYDASGGYKVADETSMGCYVDKKTTLGSQRVEMTLSSVKPVREKS